MEISAHILPRRVILAGLILLALGLRLWGLGWGGLAAGASQHPDEWTWQVIESLSFSQPTYQGIWTQAFYTLAALLRGLISILVGWLGVVVGEVRNAAELALPARFAGRLTVALLGTMQVWMAYMVGRRFMDSVATGLLAAALVAVNPLLVAHSHYLSLDVPLGLAVLGCLWAAWRVVDSPRPLALLVAGLGLGLCVTTRGSGILIAPVSLGALFLAWRRARPTIFKAALIGLPCWLGGLALGLVLGYPGFLLRLPEVGDILFASIGHGHAAQAGWWDLLVQRWRGAAGILGRVGGLDLILLWCAGLGMTLWRRQWLRSLLGVFPLLYLLASLTVLTGSVEGQQTVWLPAAAILASWPLVVVCRRLPGRWQPAVGVLVLGCLLCAWPLWRSVGASYLFWQQDTLDSARFWVRANLPAAALVEVGPRTPLGLHPLARPLDPQLNLDGLLAKGGYVITSSLAEESDGAPGAAKQAAGQLSREALEGLQLLKVFDLRGEDAVQEAGPDFPRWVSPRLEVRAVRPDRGITQPMALLRPWVGSSRAYAVIQGGQSAYSRAENAIWLKETGRGQRVLHLDHPTANLGLALYNLGQDLAQVEISQGPWPSKQASIYPGQRLTMPLESITWPPVAAGVHPVRVQLSRGGGLLARLEWDPLLLGRLALEAGRPASAVAYLERIKAPTGPSFEARALLAGAQARLGRWEEAAASLASLADEQGEPARTYLALAAQREPDAAWEADLAKFTGYYPDLLRQSSSLTFVVGGPQCISEGQEVPLSGEGFDGAYLRSPGRGTGYLKLWLHDPWPEGALSARLKLSTRGIPPPGEELARVEIWSHGWGGGRLLAQRVVRGADLAAMTAELALPFRHHRPGGRLEIRLNFSTPVDLRLEELTVGVDLPGHMRSILRWYHEARGRVALQAGRHAEAVASFQALLQLNAQAKDILLPLAQALLEAGRLDEAYKRARQAEETFPSQPISLSRVRELYQLLQRPQDAARVERQLTDLHPSLKREARLANGLTLLGYDLSRSEVRRGGELDVTYYWQVWSTPPLDYYIFVHLKGADRILPFDHLLDHGRQPMTELTPGQVVRESYRITVPADAPPGRYRLLTGMWDPRFTGRRAAVTEGEGQGGDEVTLATVEVR